MAMARQGSDRFDAFLGSFVTEVLSDKGVTDEFKRMFWGSKGVGDDDGNVQGRSPPGPYMQSGDRDALVDLFENIRINNKVITGYLEPGLECDFDAPTDDIVKDSTNCVHFDHGGVFTKVQIMDMTDPLINEVVVTKRLTELEQTASAKLFSEYVKHCLLLDKGNVIKNMFLKGVSGDELKFQALQTKYVNILRIDQYIKSIRGNAPLLQHLLKKFSCFIEKYVRLASQIGMTHNDLHLNNLVLHNMVDRYEFKVIDYGRTTMTKPEDYDKFVKDCEMFGLDATKMYRELYGDDKTPLKRYQIVDRKLGCWADVATACLNIMTMVGVGMFYWPSYFVVIPTGFVNMGTRQQMVDVLRFLEDTNQTSTLFRKENKYIYQGLAFMTIYVKCARGIAFDKTTMVKIDDLYGGELMSNGVVRSRVYHADSPAQNGKRIMECVHEEWNAVWTAVSEQAGGHVPRHNSKIKTRPYLFPSEDELFVSSDWNLNDKQILEWGEARSKSTNAIIVESAKKEIGRMMAEVATLPSVQGAMGGGNAHPKKTKSTKPRS